MKTCPYCESEIANNAKTCKYCGESVVEEKNVKTCPYCKSEIPITAKKCRYCREWVEEPELNLESDKDIKKYPNRQSIEVSKFQKKGLLKASGFRFFCAQFLDFLIAWIPCLGLANIFYMWFLGTSLGYDIFGLIALNENSEQLTKKQKRVFAFCYFPNLFHITYFVPIILLWERFLDHNSIEVADNLGLILMLVFSITCIPGFVNMIIGIFSQKNSIEGRCGIRRYIRDLSGIKKASGFFLSILDLSLISIFGNVMLSRQLPSQLYQGDFFFLEIGKALEGIGTFFLFVRFLGTIITFIVSLCIKKSENVYEYRYNRKFTRYLTAFGILFACILFYGFMKVWLKMY